MERVVQGLAEAQVKLGHEVHVLTSNCYTRFEQNFENLNNVNVHRIESIRLRYPDLTIPRAIPFELLRQADFVHVHGHNSLFSQRILIQARKLGIKTACYFMAVNAFADHPNRLVRSIAPFYGKKTTRDALVASNLALVKSFRDLAILRDDYRVDATYLPDAVPSAILLSKKGNVDEFVGKFKIKQRRFFLFIGRMHKLKGPHIMVNALKYANNDVAAVFIGPDGGYLKETLKLAEKLGVKDRVYVLGFVDEATKLEAIDSAVALVLPSIADYVEVYPGVISEAWAREKPVIASNVGGIPYRIQQGVTGILVPPSNYKLLALAMSSLYKNNTLAEKMGRNGKVDVFSWKTIGEKSINLYSSIMDRQGIGNNHF